MHVWAQLPEVCTCIPQPQASESTDPYNAPSLQPPSALTPRKLPALSSCTSIRSPSRSHSPHVTSPRHTCTTPRHPAQPLAIPVPHPHVTSHCHPYTSPRHPCNIPWPSHTSTRHSGASPRHLGTSPRQPTHPLANPHIPSPSRTSPLHPAAGEPAVSGALWRSPRGAVPARWRLPERPS